MDGAIAPKTVTNDTERLMQGATKLKRGEFGDTIIQHIDDQNGFCPITPIS